MSRKKREYRPIRLGESKVGMEVFYWSSLHLPPMRTTIAEVGPVKHGVHQRYQEIRVNVPEYRRTDHETIMESGCERIAIPVVKRLG